MDWDEINGTEVFFLNPILFKRAGQKIGKKSI
jgi:hypothetical protein